MTNLGNVTITTTIAANSVALGTDTTGNYVATIAANATTGYGGIVVSGSGETAAVVIGVDPTNADFIEGIQDAVGGMVIGNTENGIAVTYDDATGKLNFDVADPVITLSGDVTGSATMTNLGNVTITTTIAANSIELGTDTTGNYVATITANALSTYSGIIVSGSGTESAPVVIGIDPTNSDFRNNIRDITASILTAGGVINSGNGIDITYNDIDNSVTINPNDPLITIAGAVTGSATMTNLSNTTITVAQANNSVTLGQHTVGNYVATITAGTGVSVTGSGSETAAVTIAVNPSETVFLEAMQDIVGGMVTGNTENGIAVTYDDTNGKLDFDVNDPVITLSGDVTGSATMTNLGNVTITTTIAADSIALGTDTTGNYVATITAGSGITVANAGTENATVTISVNPSEAGLLEALQDVVGGMVDTNTESGIAVTYDDATGKLNFDVADPVITLSGDVTGSATMTNLGNVTITTTIAANSIELGTDTTGNYVATVAANATLGFGGITVNGSGSETAAVTIGINPANADFIEGVQDIVGGMVDTNTESGIAVTYNDTTGKLNFDVADPVITLSGDVTGSATMTDLANVTITTTIAANSVALGADTTGNYVATIAANATAGYGGITVSGSGSETAAVVIGIDSSNADFIENMQDLIGGMVSTNTENGIAVTYNDITNKLDFDVGDFTITLGGDLTGSQTITNLGSITLNATIAANSVALGTDTTGNYVATIAANATTGYGGIVVSGSGSETAAVVIGVDPTNADFIEGIQDIVGTMVTGGVENGITVTYNDGTNKLDFQMPNITYTLSGDVTGSITTSNLANVTITTTIAADSVALGTDTTGAYVASIAANVSIGYSGIVVSGSGESAAVTIGLDTTNADFRNSVRDFVAPMFTTGNGLTVSYTDTATGGTVVINPNDPLITIAGAVTGSETMTNLANTTITVAQANNSVTLGQHTVGNYVANITANASIGYSGIVVSGSGETANVVIGLDTTNADFRNSVRDLVAPLFSTGNGISVVYTDTALGGSITLDPNDPTISLSGVVTGSQVMTNLGNVGIVTTLTNDSVTLGQHTVGNYVANITANSNIGSAGILITNGAGESSNTVIGLDSTNADFRNTIRDITRAILPAGLSNGITYNYNDTTNLLDITPNNPTIAITGSVIGSQEMTALGNVSITVAQANNSVTLGTHTVGNYVANVTAGKGIAVVGANVETSDITISVDTGEAQFVNDVQDIVGLMLGGNTENGLNVTYDPDLAKINFDVNDPTITLTGDVSGSVQMVDLASVSITCTVADSSHDHVIANVIGLQAALDSKVGGSNLALTGTTTVNNLNPALNAAYSLGTTDFRFTNVWATTLNGTAVQAQYADLAERYHADAKYPIGTVVKLGGSKEITATTTENDPQVIGVVSENPAYLMNDGAGDPDEWPPIAMTGRVRVKIVGLVTKGQRIVSSNEPGVAMAVNDNELTSVMTVVGRALRSSTDPNIKLVECIIGKL
jgi:hypothetical protein